MSKNFNRTIKRKYYKLSKHQSSKIKLFTLSSLVAQKPKSFSSIAQVAYNITENICKEDYPKYFSWYWTKHIPKVFNGTGEVVICTVNNNVAGVSFLKKEENEAKICTFLVLEEYRGMHISSKILEKSFCFLGTTKPLITIADYKIPMFIPIIRKYGWVLTQTMNKGYYNDSSVEYVYNGTLPE